MRTEGFNQRRKSDDEHQRSDREGARQQNPERNNKG
jgi:hypothetical protein